jgi:hypothetical protein
MTSRCLKPVLTIAAILAALGTPGFAAAETLTADFTHSHFRRAAIMSVPLTGDVNTVTFHWTRRDAAGPGVDGSIPETFTSFCVDLEQVVRTGTEYRFDVLTSEEAGYTPAQDLALRRLWAGHFDDITGPDTSAAFQLAVWELVYDTDLNLSTGSFTSGGPGASKTLAQGWLDGLGGEPLAGGLPTLRVLRNDDSQDQLTVDIPEPGAAACAFMGIVMLRRRRRA